MCFNLKLIPFIKTLLFDSSSNGFPQTKKGFQVLTMELFKSKCNILFIIIFITMIKMVKTRNKTINDELCDCMKISLESISENKNDELICYSYSIQYEYNKIKDTKCKQKAKSIIFGVCDENNDLSKDDEILQTSIISMKPRKEQLISNSYKSSKGDESFIGLKMENSKSSWTNEQITICMKNIYLYGYTSNNIQFILENDDIVTCYNDPNQNGLPCLPKKNDVSDIESVNIESVNSESSNSASITMINNDLLNKNDFLNKSNGLSVTARQYIKFIFITVIIIIVLNAMCCIFLACRQSGALDKYFDDNYNNNNNDNYQQQIDCFSDDDCDADIDIDTDNDQDSVISNNNDIQHQDEYINDISFSDLIIMRNECDNKESEKLKISVTPFEE